MNIQQFDIWNINLNPTRGSEQSGIRPALVIETNAVMNKGKTTIIIPLSSKIDNIFSFDVVLKPNKENGLQKKSKLKLRQIRVIDKSRLIKKVGKLQDTLLQEKLLESLKLLFDFERMF